jgi:hypothetical protein
MAQKIFQDSCFQQNRRRGDRAHLGFATQWLATFVAMALVATAMAVPIFLLMQALYE